MFRKLERGINPDAEIGRFLSEVAGFPRIPQLAGAIEYALPDGSLMTLGLLQAFVPNQGDAWKRFAEDLRLFYEECATRGKLPPGALQEGSFLEAYRGEIPSAVSEFAGRHLGAARILGQRTAELHCALATESDDPAFRAEPLSAEDLRQIAARLREEIARALGDLRDSLPRLSEEAAEEAGLVLRQRNHLLARAQLPEVADFTSLKIRIHGDYHLGQVLCVQDDYVIFDFEGEPGRSLMERKAKYPALRDVAGMLRSFSYAASAALLHYAPRRPADVERLRAWTDFWEKWTSAAFLKGYRDAIRVELVPSAEPAFRKLLELFLLEKALYELRYELNNRPGWVRIPLRGILTLLRRT